MNRGYWKFWRKTKDTRMFEFPLQFTLWCWLLNEASHSGHVYPDGNRVESGELITSIAKLATSCGQSERSVRTGLKHLEECGRITRTTSNRHTKVRIEGWATYQAKHPTGDKLTTSQRQAEGTQSRSLNSNSNSKPIHGDDEEDDIKSLTKHLRSSVRELDHKAVLQPDHRDARWIAKILSETELSPDDIRAAIDFAKTDQYCPSITSGSDLYHKITKIRIRMNGGQSDSLEDRFAQALDGEE